MKKYILFIGLLIAMVATNPSKDEYINWSKETIKAKANSNQLVGLGVDLLGSTVLNNSTTTQDYKIFSLFDTNVLGEKFKVLGIFHQFIPLSTPKQTKGVSSLTQNSPASTLSPVNASPQSKREMTNNINGLIKT